MHDRCTRPANPQFKNYGGRGISVCERWNDYKTFAEDMGERPSPSHSIDRINVNKGYEPDNCRWATRKEQQRNKRHRVFVTIEGVEFRAIELAEQSGLKTDTIIARAASGLPLSEVLSPRRRVYTDGLRFGGLVNGARQRARTHCSAGHEFTAENTRITPEGWRNCRICHAAKMRRLNANKKLAQAG